MSTSSNSQVGLSLKLFIDKSRRKILFGEADKKVIDFLFAILTLPIASILDLVPIEAMAAGPLRNLYHSVENLDAANYFQETHLKDNLLKPKLHIPKSRISLCPIKSSFPQGYYICGKCCSYISTELNRRCPACSGYEMGRKLRHVPSSDRMIMEESSNAKTGYVKETFTYLVMEDLTVEPLSVNLIVSILAELGVDDVGMIEQKVVYFDIKKGLSLVGALLRSSSTVLSDVFLKEINFENSSNEEVASEINESESS